MAPWPKLRHPHQHADEDDPSKTARHGGAADAETGGAAALWRILDPHATSARDWNRVFLLVCAAALVVDPLFFYALSISRSCQCLFLDGWYAVSVTALRCMADLLYVWNMWLQLRMAYFARRSSHFFETLKPYHGSEFHRLKSVFSVLFDLFVLLPVPQVLTFLPLRSTVFSHPRDVFFCKIVMWVAAPLLLRRGGSVSVMTIFLVTFLAQYIPKVYHSFCLLRRMQNLSGYVFGTLGWGLALNLICFFIVAHAAGACWYLLGIQRAAKCLREQCRTASDCGNRFLTCEEPVFYGTSALVIDSGRAAWGRNTTARAVCLDSGDNYGYGVFEWAVPLVTSDNRVEKILLPIFWAIMSLSSFGDLSGSTDWLEIVFNIVVISSGLVLVTMLIGNIKVFLTSTKSKKQMMNLRMKNVEWWMKRRSLPQGFRRRVRQYERQRWAAMRGVDESEMTSDLPEGLRRDIKYYLCLNLVRQVPLFQHMDSLVLENICDRVKSLVFPKGETIIKEGDPVKRMLFVVRGHLQSSQELRDGLKSSCMLGPGNFTGDELLSWCLRRPFVERLPPSSATLQTLETTETFGLDAADVKYVTQHFRHTFINDKVRRSARYYSPGWRTWAAVAIQLAWRRHRHRLTLTSLSFIRPRRPPSRSSSMGEDKLRLYAAILTSPKPNLEDFTS